MVKNKEEIDLYNDQRFDVAKTVSRSVFMQLEKLSLKNKITLLSLLHHTKITCVCEVLQPEYQHIVNISSLDEPTPYFLSFTESNSYNEEEEKSLLSFCSKSSLELMKALGFNVPSYSTFKLNELDDKRKEVRKNFLLFVKVVSILLYIQVKLLIEAEYMRNSRLTCTKLEQAC